VTPDNPIVFLVDDDPRVREALCSLISSVGIRVAAFGSAAEFLEFEKPDAPSCLILDLQLPDVSGLQLQQELAGGDAPPIVFITGHGDIPSSVRAMKAGAIEFLSKPFGEQELLQAIDTALALDRAARQKRSELAELRKGYTLLTPREREVLPFVVAGFANKETAGELGTLPFYRMEKLEDLLGIPLPASTQWEIVEEAAEVMKAARDELIRQAAQGQVLHNDDTSMRVLRMAREPSDDRTGVFTSGIVSTQQGRRIALYFTGRQHAGENLRDVLDHRAGELAPPLQMCDALSRNTPKLDDGTQILLANCLAHGRRQFVEVSANFPEPCRYVLATLGAVYKYDAEARERRLSPSERLEFHQRHSGPVMKQLHEWLEAQFAQKQVEPNSGLGKAITYFLRHWKGLTAFLREAGAPLDNNLCTAARGSAEVMPLLGLCRVAGLPESPAYFLMVSDAA
jgi:FixJ family two-component response regulator